MSDEMFRPQGTTRLQAGQYALVCIGPDGVVLSLDIDLSKREPTSCLVDDERLQELLVVTSVAGGVVEHELHKMHEADRSVRAPVEPGEGGVQEA